MKKTAKMIHLNLPKVRPMFSTSGHIVKNQYLVNTQDCTVFQSYETRIVAIQGGITYLDNMWDHSQTTSRYRNMFLCESTKETQAKIDSGEYIVMDLN